MQSKRHFFMLLVPISWALAICSVYSEKHDIVYNVKKSVCMVINSGKYKITNFCPSILGRKNIVFVVSERIEPSCRHG